VNCADGNLPARLRTAGGPDFERRVLQSAAGEQPSPEACERMAEAVGTSAPGAPGAAATGTALRTGGAGSKTAGAASLVLPWILAEFSAVGVTAFVVGTSPRRTSSPQARPAPAQRIVPQSSLTAPVEAPATHSDP